MTVITGVRREGWGGLEFWND